MPDEDEDAYSPQGDLSVGEADRILPRLEREDIRFEIDPHVGRDSARASGNSPSVTLFVHKEDVPRWERIREEFFPL